MSSSPPLPETAPPPAPATALPDGWQALPPRGAGLAALGAFIGTLMAGAFALGVAWLSAPGLTRWLDEGAIAVAVIALGAAVIAYRRHRFIRWRLDAQGFALMQGRLWRSETHVPISRVQHLDVRRGPLDRAARLATLVVHTAGTRLNAVSVSGLDQRDAERLRERLAHQLDRDDDAL